MGVAVEHQLAGQVDGVQGSCQPHGAAGMAVDVADERLSERLCEVEVGALGADVQVDGSRSRAGGHEAVDVGLGAGAVVGNGADVYLLLLLVPGHVGVQRAHAAILELEMLDVQMAVSP